MRILLTGRNGQVGYELERALAPLAEVRAFDRETLDLAKPDDIVARVRDMRPDVIVNAGAYTAVDKAESEPEIAFAINAEAPAVFAEEAKQLGALLIHYSTDYVFDGEKAGPYAEDDAPNPRNVYGRSKLRGEQLVQVSGCRHLILRTSWVYASRGKNFLLTMLRLAHERPELRVVDDQRGAPTWARYIAEATATLLRSAVCPVGLYHLTASGETTWCGFACEIVRLSGVATAVQPIASADYPVPAARPRNSVLSNAKLARVTGVVLPDWRIGVRSCFAEMNPASGGS